jgi:hypothetical protein
MVGGTSRTPKGHRRDYPTTCERMVTAACAQARPSFARMCQEFGMPKVVAQNFENLLQASFVIPRYLIGSEVC